ncbi:MAG TPA: UDP-glucose--hexose-1-phosphate uridylyltransferase [Bryobacteraceae bacterium]|nr:UDP-glucose--hexose-1-phosphate uridylyltransferase [Bryobacteraceae bacterium]
MDPILSTAPHRRYNPLTGDWVLVSPHRTQRPWQGQVEKTAPPVSLSYDANCYLCPGNPRAGGVRNPEYDTTFVFDNDFAALRPDTPKAILDQDGLIRAETERGLCRVICFSPNHSLTVSRMTPSALRLVVDQWTDQYIEIGGFPFINAVQIFENRGEMMGASNPHPHCQIWANENIPNELGKELRAFDAYRAGHAQCLLCHYQQLESRDASRIVCENDSFAALVPFWAVWPFEILVIPKRHVTGLDQLSGPERDQLSDILKRVTTRYDNVFEVSFPYTMGFHQRPSDGTPHDSFHMHAHFYPPLLRSATVRKFMVGYEMLGSPQRDITAESAASRLREVGEAHYLDSPAAK